MRITRFDEDYSGPDNLHEITAEEALLMLADSSEITVDRPTADGPATFYLMQAIQIEIDPTQEPEGPGLSPVARHDGTAP